jgi:hypothetical protein
MGFLVFLLGKLEELFLHPIFLLVIGKMDRLNADFSFKNISQLFKNFFGRPFFFVHEERLDF